MICSSGVSYAETSANAASADSLGDFAPNVRTKYFVSSIRFAESPIAARSMIAFWIASRASFSPA